MHITLAEWSVMLLCLSMALAIGGGLYEHMVLTPLWSASPPSSFAIIQPGTGVLLQKFWIPVHTAIAVFLILSLVLTWRQMEVRRLLLIGLSSYIVMRVWSGLYFIREMLAFQPRPFSFRKGLARPAANAFQRVVPRAAWLDQHASSAPQPLQRRRLA
jgi:hypothetical protein